VRADAALLLEAADGRRHYVGCERACGSQPGDEVLVATGAGYRRKNSSGGQERSDSGGFS
jgi:precorrin-3B synthase